MLAILWGFRRRNPPPHAAAASGKAQIASAAAMAFGHGLQDAQKTMGVIVLALVTYGSQDDFDVPLWVKLSAALAISAGTYAGGWRIMRTLGRRIIELDPPRGFAAETTAAGVLYTTAFVYAVPVSTTHTITSAIMGAGATQAAVGRALGRRPHDRHRLGADDPGRRAGRRACSTSWPGSLVLDDAGAAQPKRPVM